MPVVNGRHKLIDVLLNPCLLIWK